MTELLTKFTLDLIHLPHHYLAQDLNYLFNYHLVITTINLLATTITAVTVTLVITTISFQLLVTITKILAIIIAELEVTIVVKQQQAIVVKLHLVTVMRKQQFIVVITLLHPQILFQTNNQLLILHFYHKQNKLQQLCVQEIQAK